MYCTLDNLTSLQPVAVLLQLADDDSDGEFITVADNENRAYKNVVSAIAEADALIDSYLSGRYPVPLAAPVPVVIAQTSAQLAICSLYDRRRELDVPEGIKERRQRAVSFLKDIKAEKANIVELSKTTPSAYEVNKTDEDRQFPDSLLDKM